MVPPFSSAACRHQGTVKTSAGTELYRFRTQQAAERAVPLAVSYTHLDVYKRQVQHGYMDAPQRQGRAGQGNVPLHGKSASGRISDPVSYTHLDVYKRQALSPVEPREITVDEEAKKIFVIVQDDKDLSKACLLYTSRCV